METIGRKDLAYLVMKHGRMSPSNSKEVPASSSCFQRNKLVMLSLFLMTATGVLLFDRASKGIDGDWRFLEMQTSESTPYETTLGYTNLLVEDQSQNYTGTLQTLLRLNGSRACHNVSTNYTKLLNLPAAVGGRTKLTTGVKHLLILAAYSQDGKERCAGGDYYEVDFHNEHYRSRLPTVDYGNGTYGLELLVPSRWSGLFDLEISLLFSNWHGMDLQCKECPKPQLLLQQEIHMLNPIDDHFFSEELEKRLGVQVESLKNLTRCSKEDFYRPNWSGRWTRSWFNDVCEPDEEHRFKCLPEEHYQCEEPWCFGPVGRLESNGWQYSAHCSFKIFERDEAWKCLGGKWWLLWGDSNFQDTIRNILLFILDWQLPPKATVNDFGLDRTYERLFINQNRLDQGFRVSMMFNGANNDRFNGEGLGTIRHIDHQERIRAHFSGESRAPDTIIMNSGLHDGSHDLNTYLAQVDYTIEWWTNFYRNITAERKPTLIWRFTVTPAGDARQLSANPNKLEIYNLVMAEKLLRVRHELPVMFVDTFDLTFPWHYTNTYSDGGHYGRQPGLRGRPAKAHYYFVDLMNAHIWLNALCS